MAQFNLHAQDLQQSKLALQEWFDVEGLWSPTQLAGRIAQARDDLGDARSGIIDASEQVVLERSRLEEAGFETAALSTLIRLLDECSSDCNKLYHDLDNTGVMLYRQEEAKTIHERLQEAIEAIEPDTFEEVEAEIKRLVEEHRSELDETTRRYQTAREEWFATARILEDAGTAAGKCGDLEIETGWFGALESAINLVNGLPEDPRQDSDL